MKKINFISFIIAAIFLSAPFVINSQEGNSDRVAIRVAWDHDGTNTAAYRIYISMTGPNGPFEMHSQHDARVNGSPVQIDIPRSGNFWLTVTAVSPFGLESLPSDALWVPGGPNRPTNLIIPAQINNNGQIITEN